MENEKTNRYNEDEFDIEALTWKLYKMTGKIIFKLSLPLLLAILKPIKLIIFMLAAIGLAILVRYTWPPVYQASFIIRPSTNGEAYYMGLLNDLSTMVKDDDAPILAKHLNITDEYACKVTKISLNAIKRNKYIDTIEAVDINLHCTDFSLFDTLQRSILKYLENNEYYTKMRNIRMTEINSLKEKLDYDMAEIDSMKPSLAQSAQPRGNAGGFVFGEPIDPLRVYEQGLELYRQKVSLNSQMKYINSFELVKKCAPTHKPYWPRLSYLLLAFGIFAFIALCLTNYKELK